MTTTRVFIYNNTGALFRCYCEVRVITKVCAAMRQLIVSLTKITHCEKLRWCVPLVCVCSWWTSISTSYAWLVFRFLCTIIAGWCAYFVMNLHLSLIVKNQVLNQVLPSKSVTYPTLSLSSLEFTTAIVILYKTRIAVASLDLKSG